ncbi:hypothetical protein SAMN05444358_106136 [Ruegeria halocynthiae]|uniref:Uncharacterized protein n=1 Tax=Ruegeria halocynthiae TaxID=985054 RepID=A0A1H3C485_9RHOB|nr:hypothetical protein [Ruegeria halocynthiae]SDX48963.1 hypothetical protein SAMN05444358_106136 [Ruegeria halocynthiae]
MLSILSTFFEPHRAVSIYVFLKSWWLLITGVVTLIAVFAGLLLLNDDGTHEHHSFLTVAVLSATPINGDLKHGVVASVRLPDGSAVSITTTEGPIARTVGTEACVEKRVFVESGEPRYRFKLPRNCGAG